ncbi:MAG: hypothetical protein DRP51_04015 [Candidatus Zixiibacteriota bacterium]|nr:MAG: hypothetical protein DRP51_04015 [candidate division Zixibacteria bacterium]
MTNFKQIDIDKVRTISLKSRKSKAKIKSFGRVYSAKNGKKFFESLPGFLKARELIEFIGRVSASRKRGLPFHVMMGAHSIKVGLTPILIDLMKRKIITGLSLNSAGLIHDLELAFIGQTSEDVSAGLRDGTFGMAEQTGRMFAEVVELADRESIGLGEAAGKYINNNKAKFRKYSLFAGADKFCLPATVHVAIGTDIVAQQKSFCPGPTAESSYRDFKILSNILIQADRGGCVANIGSAVLLPEVFLKALTVARNLVKSKCRITTANFDMINHYRPLTNVVKRPTDDGGRGFNFTGHHEIMIPLLAWGLKSYIKKIV